MPGQAAFPSQPSLTTREYGVTSALFVRPGEIIIRTSTFDQEQLGECDSPLVALIAENLRDEGVDVLMCLRPFKYRYEIEPADGLYSLSDAVDIGQRIDEVMQLYYELRERHDPVYSNVHL